MNKSKESNTSISLELLEEANQKYLQILKEYKVEDLLEYIDYETIESERYELLDMTIEEVLRDWSRSGLI